MQSTGPRYALKDVAGFVYFLSGLLLFLALATHRETDDGPTNLIGNTGIIASQVLTMLLGRAAFVIPVGLLYVGGFALYRGDMSEPLLKLGSLVVSAVTCAVWIGLLSEAIAAGWIGKELGSILSLGFGKWGGLIVSFGLFVPAALVATGSTIQETGKRLGIIFKALTPETSGTPLLKVAGALGAIALLRNQFKDNKDGDSTPSAPDSPVPPITLNDSAPPVQQRAPEIFNFQSVSTMTPNDLTQKVAPVESRASSTLGRVYVTTPSEQKVLPIFPGFFTLDQSRFIFKRLDPSSYSSSHSSLAPTQPSEVVIQKEVQQESIESTQIISERAFPEETPDINLISEDIPEEFHEIENEPDFQSADAIGRVEVEQMSTEVHEDASPEIEEEPEIDSIVPVKTRSLLTGIPSVVRKGGKYSIPTDILRLSPAVPEADVEQETQETKSRLEQALKDYGIPGRVVRIQRGPIITLYEILLDPGVKLSRITGIQNEIRMTLAASSVRIVAPLPGKGTVGVEIPNKTRQIVTLGEIIRRDREFFNKQNRLGIALGKDIAGKNVFMDVARLPHLLIGGTTGSGKSNYMNALIVSLLYNRSPEEMRLILIDPKRVELNRYEGIPHLLMPVVTDIRKVSRALAWAVDEMERRYMLFSGLKVKDIVSYNSAPEREKMPYIVIVMDELGDLMMIAKKEVEDAIIRLTQMARAVGIHVIMATQRPTVDVITGVIKANAPARIAFHVAQRVDSTTILDDKGAETLLGEGDMLCKPPSGATVRIQSPFLTEEETELVVSETRRYATPVYVELADPEEENVTGDDDEPIDSTLVGDAWQIILDTGKTSISHLQRRMGIGFNRAANVIEALEKKGCLGPAIGNRPREILKSS